jgi:hypothetical protein
LRAAISAMGTESSTPAAVAMIAICRLSRKPSIIRAGRAKFGGNAPAKIRPARPMPSLIRSQSKGRVPSAQTT